MAVRDLVPSMGKIRQHDPLSVGTPQEKPRKYHIKLRSETCGVIHGSLNYAVIVHRVAPVPMSCMRPSNDPILAGRGTSLPTMSRLLLLPELAATSTSTQGQIIAELSGPVLTRMT